MTNIEKLGECVEVWPHGICDACIGVETGVKPHQQVVQICHKLAQRARIERRRGVCSRCNEARLVNTPSKIEVGSKESSPVRVEVVDGAWLDECRRMMVAALNRLEKSTPKGEGFGQRVTRLRDSGKILGNVAALMMTLASFRNLAHYEEYKLTDREAKMLTLAWDELRQRLGGEGGEGLRK